MKCQEVESLFSRYIDSELETGKTALVYEHLQQCTSCKEEVDDYRKWDQAAAVTLKDHPFDSNLANGIMDQVRLKESPAGQVSSGKIISFPQTVRRSLAWAAALLVVTCLSLYFLLPQKQSTPTRVEMAKIKGQPGVLIFRESKSHWIDASGKKTVALYRGDRVVNHGKEPLDIQLSDKSQILLDQNSELSMLENEGGKEIHLFGSQARAFFKITSQKKTFSVHTDGVTVSVVGTEFIVSVDNQKIETLVYEGKVKVHPLRGKAHLLTRGQASTVYKITQNKKVKDLPLSQYHQKAKWIPHYNPPPLPTRENPSSSTSSTPPIGPTLKGQSPEGHQPRGEKTDYPIKVKKPKKDSSQKEEKKKEKSEESSEKSK